MGLDCGAQRTSIIPSHFEWHFVLTTSPFLQTEVYRKVFRCVPDDLVTSWTHYRENASHAEKFNKPPAKDTVLHGMQQAVPIHGGPGTHGAGGGGSGGGVVGQGHEGSDGQEQPQGSQKGDSPKIPTEETNAGLGRSKSTRTRRSSRGNSVGGMDGPPTFSSPTEGWNEWEMSKMEELLAEVRGHLGTLYSVEHREGCHLLTSRLFPFPSRLPHPIPRDRGPRQQLRETFQLQIVFSFSLLTFRTHLYSSFVQLFNADMILPLPIYD